MLDSHSFDSRNFDSHNFDSHSDNPEKRQIFNGLFNGFVYGVFMRNLIDFEKIFVNVMSDSNNGVYVGVRDALLSRTPYLWRHNFMNLLQNRALNDENIARNQPKWQFIDCWCMRDKADFEAFLGDKKILRDLRGRYGGKNVEQIRDALTQMQVICDEAKSANRKNTRAVCFAMPLSRQNRASNRTSKTHKIMRDLLVDFLKNHLMINVLYAVMDLESRGEVAPNALESKGALNANATNTPYFALGAIVLES